MTGRMEKGFFPGRETFGTSWWWAAQDDEGKIRTFKWENSWSSPPPNITSNGMVGEATEWPTNPIRVHLCANKHCKWRRPAGKPRVRGECEHVRFKGRVPIVGAVEWDAVSPGGVSSGDAMVVPSSVDPTVATDMPSAVAEVPVEEVHVAVSPAECGGGGVGGSDVSAVAVDGTCRASGPETKKRRIVPGNTGPAPSPAVAEVSRSCSENLSPATESMKTQTEMKAMKDTEASPKTVAVFHHTYKKERRRGYYINVLLPVFFSNWQPGGKQINARKCLSGPRRASQSACWSPNTQKCHVRHF